MTDLRLMLSREQMDKLNAMVRTIRNYSVTAKAQGVPPFGPIMTHLGEVAWMWTGSKRAVLALEGRPILELKHGVQLDLLKDEKFSYLMERWTND